jgi:hypothetical protein
MTSETPQRMSKKQCCGPSKLPDPYSILLRSPVQRSHNSFTMHTVLPEKAIAGGGGVCSFESFPKFSKLISIITDFFFLGGGLLFEPFLQVFPKFFRFGYGSGSFLQTFKMPTKKSGSGARSGTVQIITDTDPGGPETYGSGPII